MKGERVERAGSLSPETVGETEFKNGQNSAVSLNGNEVCGKPSVGDSHNISCV